jgi:hypothetical protein
MAKKKKKSQKKNQKLVQLQYKNEYLKELKHLLIIICGAEITSKIPKYIYSYFYTKRYYEVFFEKAEDTDIPNSKFDFVKDVLKMILEKQETQITSEGYKISLKHYFSVFQTLTLLQSNISEDEFDEAKELIETLNNSFENYDHLEKAHNMLANLLSILGPINSGLEERLYWFDFNVDALKDKPNSGLRFIIKMYGEKPKTISVIINNVLRPVIRLGCSNIISGIEWISIKASLLNIQGSFAELPLDVYMQSHAIRRFNERIDNSFNIIVFNSIKYSFINPNVVFHKNKILIEFKINDIKAGYFLAVVVESKVIIRTFLFVTNSGTPEGEKLAQNTGLNKIDKKYLAIDRISTFLEHDISKNKTLSNIFIESGCQCVLDLHKELSKWKTKSAGKSSIQLMLNYLNQ